MSLFIGIFFILHGLVHLLYMGHSLNYFELEQGFVWPENSKLLQPFFSIRTKKQTAAALCIIAAVSFILSGIFVIIGFHWVNQSALVAIISSTVLYFAFWDGSIKKLHTQGGIAILINTFILIIWL